MSIVLHRMITFVWIGALLFPGELVRAMDDIPAEVISRLFVDEVCNVVVGGGPSGRRRFTPSDYDETRGTGVVAKLPSAAEFPLSREMKAAIRRHPIYAMREKYAGKTVNFSFPPAWKDELTGEKIQSEFTAKVFEEIFDSAYISHPSKKSPAELGLSVEKGAFVWLKDRSESAYRKTGKPNKDELPMEVAKPANGTISGIRGDSVRRVLGIEPEQKVVSLYAHKVDEVNPTVFRDIDKGVQPDVIHLTLTETGVSETGLRERYGELIRDYKIVELQDIERGGLSKYAGQKVIVINNTKGKLGYIHASSDLAVIVGPVNLFEPLNARVPTVAVRTPRVKPIDEAVHELDFDEDSYMRMVDVLKRTGGGHYVPSAEELGPLLRGFATQPPSRDFTPPYLLPGTGGTPSPFDQYLNELQRILIENEF